jgi:hypothetical protein
VALEEHLSNEIKSREKSGNNSSNIGEPLSNPITAPGSILIPSKPEEEENGFVIGQN